MRSLCPHRIKQSYIGGVGARISDCESEQTQTENRMEFNGRESSEANERAGEENGSSSEIEPECVEIDEVEKSKIGIMRALVEAQDPTSKVFPKDPFHLFFSDVYNFGLESEI